MDPKLLEELARHITEEMFLHNWKFWLVLAAVVFVAGAGATFLVGYSKKRGESLATKADLENVLSQVKQTTELTEKIRGEIQHSQWTAKEAIVLRRVKLEELMGAIYDLRKWIAQESSNRLFSGPPPSIDSPVDRADLLVNLYFPELKQEFGQYIASKSLSTYFIECAMKLNDAAQDQEKRRAVLNAAREGFKPHYEAHLKLISQIEKRARAIMKETVGF